MSVGEENWQMTRPTIRERTKFFFNNDRLSDIRFVVRKMDGESESAVYQQSCVWGHVSRWVGGKTVWVIRAVQVSHSHLRTVPTQTMELRQYRDSFLNYYFLFIWSRKISSRNRIFSWSFNEIVNQTSWRECKYLERTTTPTHIAKVINNLFKGHTM